MIKCLLCKSLSLPIICKDCQSNVLKPSFYTRELPCGFKVHSFYKYSDIDMLIKTKHTFIGSQVYKILAKNSFGVFSQNFSSESKVLSISLDDKVTSGYAHTAILNKALNSTRIKPIYNRLRAKNSVSYSGKSREFRLLNPREFQLKPFKEKNVILVDDIITTGSTLTQAIDTMNKAEKEVLFALTLCDVSQD